MKKEFNKPMLRVVPIDVNTVLCTSSPDPTPEPQIEFKQGNAIWDNDHPVL